MVLFKRKVYMAKHDNSFWCLGLISCIMIGLVFLPGCGRQQAVGGTFGAATGALIGTAVTGRHDQGTGALVGGLVGALAGGAVGQAADEEEADRRQIAIEIHHRQREAELQEENRRLRDKWCVQCGNHVCIENARSCPQCGGRLIHEKVCRLCSTHFSPRTGYRYCPYCSDQTPLVGR